jgi:hypothetical protein
MVFEDIFSFYTSRMMPEAEDESVDVSDALDEIMEVV